MTDAKRATGKTRHVPASKARPDRSNSRTVDQDVAELSEFVGTREVAEICGIVPKTIWQYVNDQLMPEPIHVGRTLLWRRSVIEEWARDRPKPGRPRKERIAGGG
jgi:predicted DNA-binding transcriptional regulator AlpA